MAKRSPRKQLIDEANASLEPSALVQLNREFYRLYRPEVLTARLGLIALALEDPGLHHDKLLEGVPVATTSDTQVTFRVHADSEAGARITSGAVMLELFALHQHAAETLFRLFYVHAAYALDRKNRRAPWLDLAELAESASSLASKYVGKAIWPEDALRRKLAASVVFGAAEGQSGPPSSQTDVVLAWITYVAEAVQLAEGHNAYKHGMALLAPLMGLKSELQIVSESGEAKTVPVDDGFYYLTIAHDDAGQNRWQRQFMKVDVPFTMVAISVMTTLIENILVVGQERVCHAGELREAKLALITEMTPAALALQFAPEFRATISPTFV